MSKRPLISCNRNGMPPRCFWLLIGCIVTFFLCPRATVAGGLYISEFGTPSMGVASAGAQAVAGDASTSFHNPAGMTRITGNQIMGTGGFLYSSVEFDPDSDTPIPGGDGGDAGGFAPLLGGFYVHSLSDRWKLGVNLISITGAVLDYDNDWAGRYQNTEVTLLTLTLNPTVAYRVNDWLSVGGGPQMMYADLEIKSKAPPPNGTGDVKIDGDDLDFGYDFGALIELSPWTRIGILYQSEIEPEFGGDVKIEGPGTIEAGTDTTITLAQFVRVSAFHELNDCWALLGSVGWEDWSAFKDVNISTGRGDQKLSRNWDDTWRVAAGVHYKPAQDWLLQFGMAYDSSPVDKEDRTADMPIDRQIRYAAGLQHQWSDRLSVGGQFVFADYGTAKIRSDLLSGEYDKNHIVFFAMNANWKF
mgnify:CR=1 FL=1